MLSGGGERYFVLVSGGLSFVLWQGGFLFFAFLYFIIIIIIIYSELLYPHTSTPPSPFSSLYHLTVHFRLGIIVRHDILVSHLIHHCLFYLWPITLLSLGLLPIPYIRYPLFFTPVPQPGCPIFHSFNRAIDSYGIHRRKKNPCRSRYTEKSFSI